MKHFNATFTTPVSLLSNERGRTSTITLFLILLIGALIPITYITLKEVDVGVLERQAPEIKIIESPRGIGIDPVRVVVEFVDETSGIDEIVVRATQNGITKELERRKLAGVKSQSLTLNFPGRASGFVEGVVEFEIRAFDKSYWSNVAEEQFSLAVDYRSPALEIITEQHNAREGGSQLLIYRAVDESLALSGVKVDGKSYLGFPARLLDSELEDPELFAVLYAISLKESEEEGGTERVRAFAEDDAGNAIEKDFYSREDSRRILPRKVELSETCLRGRVRPVMKASGALLAEYLPAERLEMKTADGSIDRDQEEFALLTQELLPINEAEIKRITSNTRFERSWNQPFLRQRGVVRFSMGERLAYFAGDRLIADRVHRGYFYRSRVASEPVSAASSGVVSFQGLLGGYGETVILDHGLGVFTLYGNLSKVSVNVGDRIEYGATLGEVGKSGLYCERGAFFQVRVQGTAVEPAEWLSQSWFDAHIDAKIRRVKRLLGITRLSPL